MRVLGIKYEVLRRLMTHYCIELTVAPQLRGCCVRHAT